MDSSGTIISIRHGESEYNYAQKEYAGQMDVRDVVTKDESKELKFNYQLMDAQLCQRGIEQCMETQKQLREVPIKIVLTSPLRRCLQTTNLLFKDHPNNPKIIVEPLLREVFLSNCDVGGKLEEQIKQLINFDFNKLLCNEQIKNAPNMWGIEHFYNDVKGLKEYIDEQLKNNKQLDYSKNGNQKYFIIQFTKKDKQELLTN